MESRVKWIEMGHERSLWVKNVLLIILLYCVVGKQVFNRYFTLFTFPKMLATVCYVSKFMP